MIVVDASAAVELLAHNTGSGDSVRERLAGESSLHVPAFFDLEVLHSLRGLEAGRKVGPRALRAALLNLVDLRATYYRHAPFRQRIWTLRHNLTAYDAAYIALAEALDAPLVTTDARLARSSGHAALVELVA